MVTAGVTCWSFMSRVSLVLPRVKGQLQSLARWLWDLEGAVGPGLPQRVGSRAGSEPERLLMMGWSVSPPCWQLQGPAPVTFIKAFLCLVGRSQ